MAGTINAVFGTLIKADDILVGAGWNRSFVTGGKVGNQTLIKGLQAVCKEHELSAKAVEFLNTVKNREQSWKEL
ncbi:MAG: hypothetical protein IIA61_13995 [Candidatus Marinimicrobia bacterium]|nr:hypothetical protein [Candidatus Neomarinimicrobiota bacterium]